MANFILSGCKQLVHYSLLSFLTSSSIFLPSHHFGKCSLCIFQNCCRHHFCWWQYMPVFQLLLGLLQNAPKCGLLPSKYSSHFEQPCWGEPHATAAWQCRQPRLGCTSANINAGGPHRNWRLLRSCDQSASQSIAAAWLATNAFALGLDLKSFMAKSTVWLACLSEKWWGGSKDFLPAVW